MPPDPGGLILLRFQILKDRDGRYSWGIYNNSGTLIGKHPDGFATEAEARRDAEYFREKIAEAPIVGEA